MCDFTDGSGLFNITIPIDSHDWPDQAEIWAEFNPIASFIVAEPKIELFRP